MYGKTWLEEGVEIGEARGQRKLLRQTLELQFGPLSETVLQRLDNWPIDKLPELVISFRTAQSLSELGLED